MTKTEQHTGRVTDVEKGEGYSLNHTVTISGELYEKLYLSQKTEVAGDLRKRFANPTPLGLFGYPLLPSPN